MRLTFAELAHIMDSICNSCPRKYCAAIVFAAHFDRQHEKFPACIRHERIGWVCANYAGREAVYREFADQNQLRMFG